MSKSDRRVIVVGAGLSGLSAAYYLQKSGFSVGVLEQLDRPGGRVRTLRQQGYVIDCGPDAASAGYREWLALVRELGLDASLVPSSVVTGVARGDVVHEIDATRPWSAAFTPALSWGAKIRLSMAAPKLSRLLKGIDSFDLVSVADRDDPKVNAFQAGTKLFGEEVANYLIDPAARLTTASGARQVSCLAALAPLASWTAPLVNIRGGLDLVPRALADRVPMTYGAEVTRIQEDGEGVSVEYQDAKQQTHVERADHCVIGAMYHVARRIWAPMRRLAPSFDRELREFKLISISLGYKARCRSNAYAILIPTCEYPDLLLGFLQQNKAPDRAPDGHSLITFYTDTLAFDRFNRLSDEAITSWASALAERFFPELKGHRDLGHVTRWPHAGYLPTPGYWRNTAALLKAASTSGRVHVAGDIFGASSMETAARWGRYAADRVARANGERTQQSTEQAAAISEL